jgi:hypothetical protein
MSKTISSPRHYITFYESRCYTSGREGAGTQ